MKTNKIGAIIIDDELHCRKALRKQLEWSCPEVTLLGDYDNAEEGYKAINQLHPDLVFLDIEMPDKNGFDLIRMFDDIFFEVIFTTAYDSFAIEAFRVNAVDYLLKPIDEDQLTEAVDKVAIHLRNKDPRTYFNEVLNQIKSNTETRKIPFPTAEGITFIDVDDIIHCKAEGSYSYIFYEGGKNIFIAKTLKDIEKLCQSDRLIRVHQSHLINIQKISAFNKADGGTIIMDDNSQIPLARSRKEEWKQLLK